MFWDQQCVYCQVLWKAFLSKTWWLLYSFLMRRLDLRETIEIPQHLCVVNMNIPKSSDARSVLQPYSWGPDDRDSLIIDKKQHNQPLQTQKWNEFRTCLVRVPFSPFEVLGSPHVTRTTWNQKRPAFADRTKCDSDLLLSCWAVRLPAHTLSSQQGV